jgi:hypothetical protein
MAQDGPERRISSIFKSKPQQSMPDIPMREFFERIVDERDKLYGVRFEEAKTAVNAALIAQKESVTSAFLASEKAIVKAEEAQKAYNVAHNDLSRKMDEQNKGTMPRPEILALFKAHDDKTEAMRFFFDSKLESQRIAFEKSIETKETRIMTLEKTVANFEGRLLIVGGSIGVFSIAVSIVLHYLH